MTFSITTIDPSVGDPGNMEGGGGVSNGGKYIRQLGGVGEHRKLPHRGLGSAPDALKVIITAFQNHMEFQYVL